MEINPQSSVLFTFDAVFLLSGEGEGGGGGGGEFKLGTFARNGISHLLDVI